METNFPSEGPAQRLRLLRFLPQLLVPGACTLAEQWHLAQLFQQPGIAVLAF